MWLVDASDGDTVWYTPVLDFFDILLSGVGLESRVAGKTGLEIHLLVPVIDEVVDVGHLSCKIGLQPRGRGSWSSSLQCDRPGTPPRGHEWTAAGQ